MSNEKEPRIEGELTVEEAPIKWSLNLKDLPDEGVTGEKRADSDELRALTLMLNDIHELEVKSFVCTYDVKPSTIAAQKDIGSCLIEGSRGQFELRAELRQTCVVTLERIDTLVVEAFTQTFSSKGGHQTTKISGEGVIEDPFEEEPPMKLLKGQVQLGPLVYQYLSMAIDANPRKPGARFEEELANSEDKNEKRPSPFVVLENFRPKK